MEYLKDENTLKLLLIFKLVYRIALMCFFTYSWAIQNTYNMFFFGIFILIDVITDLKGLEK